MSMTSRVACVYRYAGPHDEVTGLKRPTTIRELLPFAAVCAGLGYGSKRNTPIDGYRDFYRDWASDWHLGGVPAVELGHKLAAAMICTSVSADTRPPWPIFALIVPGGLLQFPGGLSPHLVTVVAGTGNDGCMQWLVDAEFGGFTVASSCSTADIIADHFENKSDLGVHGMRACKCLLRLVINVCASFDDPRIAVPRAHGKTPFCETHKPAQPYNRAAIYRLGHPVKVDCRPAVADYIAGHTGRVAAVRWIVRGHWTSQAHGPGGTLRRRQWIEPYWKGRDDAPINARSHRMGG